MAVTDWIDKITDLWATIDVGQGRKIRSYAVFRKDEFPESLNEFPCALSYVTRVPVIQYSAGGPNVLVWNGITEFHLTDSVNKKQYPFVMRFPERILQAAANSITLGGSVQHFLPLQTDGMVIGVLQYGAENPHFGISLRWEVKEIITLSVSA
jgi:hypothetical protein